MSTIAAKQKAFEIWEPTLEGYFVSPRDWMASFLDFQISKLEERCANIRTRIDPRLIEMCSS